MVVVRLIQITIK